MNGPLVSVIVAAYNAEATVGETLSSVLAQDYEPFEVLVVDDGCTDATADRVGQFATVRCLRQDNAGPSAARNAGVAEARGALLAFVDADDAVPPTKLSVQVGHLLEHPEVGCVLGRQEVLTSGAGAPEWIGHDPVFGDFAGVPLMSMVVRRDAFLDAGGFDPRLRTAEDRDLLVRLRAAGVPIAVVDAVVLRRSFHGANLTFERSGNHPLLRSLKNKLDSDRRTRADADDPR